MRTTSIFIFVLFGLFAQNCSTTKKFSEAEPTIRSIMANQEAAWNRGDLRAFMDGYWKSDSLCFIGSKGLTYGWQETLDNYKKSYPDKASMGKLTFTLKKIEQSSPSSAFVIGAWHLSRPDMGDLSGYYTLFWKKIKGQWRIVADHSS